MIKTRKEFTEKFWNLYCGLKRNGKMYLLDELLPKDKSTLSLSECLEKISLVKTRKQLETEFPRHYAAIRKHYRAELSRLPLVKPQLNQEEATLLCNNYKSMKQLKEENKKLYWYLQRKGWLGICTKNIKPSSFQRSVICLNTGMVYRTIKEAAEATGAIDSKICNVCQGKRTTAAGFRWSYCDKDGNIIK